MAAASTRFLLPYLTILFEKPEDSMRLYPNTIVPQNPNNYYVDFDGTELKLHTSLCKCGKCIVKVFSPVFHTYSSCNAESFSLSASALIKIVHDDDEPHRFLIIKNNEDIANFSSTYSLPGRLYLSDDKTLNNTTLNHLKHITGSEWVDSSNIKYTALHDGIIDNIITMNRHNLTIIRSFNISDCADLAMLRSNMRLQEDAVEDVLFWTIDEILDHIDEFGPEIRSFFKHVRVREEFFEALKKTTFHYF